MSEEQPEPRVIDSGPIALTAEANPEPSDDDESDGK